MNQPAGLPAILQALVEGGKPNGNMANDSLSPILAGLGAQEEAFAQLPPNVQRQLSPFLQNTMTEQQAQLPGVPTIG